jgi:putative endonuclease
MDVATFARMLLNPDYTNSELMMSATKPPTKPITNNPAQAWFVYVIRASDDSLYTGITTDVERRFKEHFSTVKGARYFRGRKPVEVVFTEKHPDRSSALRREADIKKLPRSDKLRMVSLNND